MPYEKWQEYPMLAEDLVWLAQLKVGDPVCRWLGTCPMDLVVTEIRADRIVCQAWEFSPITGGELDEDLKWDGYQTGSIIRQPRTRPDQ